MSGYIVLRNQKSPSSKVQGRQGGLGFRSASQCDTAALTTTSEPLGPISGDYSSSGASSVENGPRNFHKATSPTKISRKNSQVSSSGGSSVLPPDVVDLVVEDKEAADRRPGPSRLRQVYRHGSNFWSRRGRLSGRG
ncbi:hypothetical protein K435DRAFT_784101 [Dendrothele bispora CBS 962.96]|uniref:Uncharacterized protein n=1 Tax=Dendrothele bispora (strain CBS 962.96) TaxID=1314807 RepID=A0A4S8L5G8_DENBC|nr:hypothetical protein K435DRAFT_784101 [Dendrothele bispora CBS 962.96]